MRPSIAYSIVFPVDKTTESTCRSTKKLSRRGWPWLVSNLITVSVNMRIAILPLSQEFNWNSATVGLIHSSFFWGYLLTQILGDIWADKISGKLVLGFGVIWWSATTVLTPIAARVGLPFLLVMRAFMGIGESSSTIARNHGFFIFSTNKRRYSTPKPLLSQQSSEAELLVVVGGGAAGIYGAIRAKTIAPI